LDAILLVGPPYLSKQKRAVWNEVDASFMRYREDNKDNCM
jgi:hypothetical protein